jgi:hypothetical protein
VNNKTVRLAKKSVVEDGHVTTKEEEQPIAEQVA